MRRRFYCCRRFALFAPTYQEMDDGDESHNRHVSESGLRVSIDLTLVFRDIAPLFLSTTVHLIL